MTVGVEGSAVEQPATNSTPITTAVRRDAVQDMAGALYVVMQPEGRCSISPLPLADIRDEDKDHRPAPGLGVEELTQSLLEAGLQGALLVVCENLADTLFGFLE